MVSDKHNYREPKFDGVDALETKICPACNLILSSSISTCPNDGTVLLHDPASTLGEKLSDQYEIVSQIASGGMGVIFKARHLALNQFVAIKMLLANQLDDEKVKRFRQEATALSRLDHPGIVHVRDFGFTENAQPYMVLDFVDGQTLSNLIKQNGVVPLSQFVPIFQQVCEAIEHAHSQGILHRDLKPSNIMLIEDFNLPIVKIVDFGIAKLLDADADKGLTKTGEVFGSPQYMSPEQAAGSKIDQRSDIYSLGCVMYEALTGVPPFAGETAMDVIFKQMNEDPVRPSKRAINRKIPKDLEDVVVKALRKSPQQRFQSVAELKNALNKTERGNTEKFVAAAQDAASSGQLTKTGIIAVAILMVAVAGVIFFNIIHGAQQPPPVASAIPATPQTFVRFIDEKPLRLLIQKGLHAQRFQNSEMTDNVLDEFDAESGTLKDIDFTHSSIHGEGLAHLIHLDLWALCLTDNPLTDRGMQEIAHMSNLGALVLNKTNITDRGLQYIQSLPHVGWLSIEDNDNITDVGLEAVAKMKTIGELTLSRLPKMTARGMAALCTLPLLHGIILDDNNISPAMVASLRRCKTLRTIDFSGSTLDDASLRELSGKPELETLILENCKQITSKGLATVASLPKLKTLVLENCNWLRDPDLEILRNCHKLAGLTLKNDENISDRGLLALQKLPLETLNVDRTGITDKGLMSLASIKTLKEVSVDRSSKLTAQGINAFKLARPDCKVDYSVDRSFIRELKEDAQEDAKHLKSWQ